MGKVIVLKSTGGDFSRGFVFAVSIANEQGLTDCEEIGTLPPDLELEQCYEEWRTAYSNLGLRSRLFASGAKVRKASPLQDCQRSADDLRVRMNQWLRSDSFSPIRDLLLSEIGRDELVRLVVQVDHDSLQQLPWALWDLFDRYPNAEISIAAPTFQRRQINRDSQSEGVVRVLAILGDSSGIDIDRDRALLAALPNARVTFLVEPKRQDLADRLWEQPWDILFFAGHSVTQKGKGYFYINQDDRVSVDDLKPVLKRAVDRGLSLGIFNSCDGFGLARSLADLQIPQTIFMREPVPDKVAQMFLQYFLAGFSQGETLYLSVRQARERLRTLETGGTLDQAVEQSGGLTDSSGFGVFPCASWLPLIFQNLAESPPTWSTLLDPLGHLAASQSIAPETLGSSPDRVSDSKSVINPIAQSVRKPLTKWSILGTLALTLGVGASICGIRSQGWLQTWELKAYDHVMQTRSLFKSDPVDNRLLVVTIDDADAELYKDPKSDLSVSDSNLILLLTKLRESNAKVIGLDLVRESQTVDPSVVRSLEQMTNVVGICINSLPNKPGGIKSPRGLEQHDSFADAAHDKPDGVVRRLLLSLPLYPESPCQSPVSLSLALASKYLGQTPDELLKRLPVMNGIDRPGSYYQANDRDSLDPVDFPHIMINYRNASIPTMSMSDLMRYRSGRLDLRDRIVVIGSTRAGSDDNHAVPLAKSLPAGVSQGNQEKTPGVWIQAEKAGYLVSLLKGERSPVWMPEERWAIALILLAAMGGGLIIRLGNNSKWHIFSLNGILILVYAGSVLAFIQLTAWIPWVPLLLATIAGSGATATADAIHRVIDRPKPDQSSVSVQ